MKQIAFIFLTLLLISPSIAQNRYSTVTPARYEPMSFDELSVAAMSLQKRYENNQKFLYELKDWILELKPEIKDQTFLSKLDKQYKDLTAIEDTDLGRATKYLKKTENAIKEIISDYNIWVSKQNSSNSSAGNTYKSQDKSNWDYARIGMAHLGNRKYALAVRAFSKHLEKESKDTDILFYRAMAKGRLGDLQGAINDYSNVIELHSNYPMLENEIAMVYNNMAHSFVRLEQYDKALPLVEKALEMDKTDWHFWDTRGEVHLNLGNYERSIADLNMALRIKENYSSYFLRGLAYIRYGEKEKGCYDLSKAGELGHDDAYAEIDKNCD